jgi:hypothetical protein
MEKWNHQNLKKKNGKEGTPSKAEGDLISLAPLTWASPDTLVLLARSSTPFSPIRVCKKRNLILIIKDSSRT